MEIRSETTVAELASQRPQTIRVFQRHGIDFCCGGKRPLAEACAEHGLAFEAIRGELLGAIDTASAQTRSWADASMRELTDYIVMHYHARLKEDLPRLQQMASKVARVHGDNHPEVVEVAQVYEALREELEPHMLREERVLFPYMVRLEALETLGQVLEASPFGTVENPIRVMELEHESAGRALARLRELTQGYLAPEDACNTYRGLYHGLEELERELHEHIHLENNVQYPAAVALERKLQAAAV